MPPGAMVLVPGPITLKSFVGVLRANVLIASVSDPGFEIVKFWQVEAPIAVGSKITDVDGAIAIRAMIEVAPSETCTEPALLTTESVAGCLPSNFEM